MPQDKYYYGVGRRKASSARSKYFPNDNKIDVTVNKKSLSDYFPEYYSQVITEALKNLGITSGKFDTFVSGGGVTGQAESIRLAITKSLVRFSDEIKPIAKTHKYLTTDNRKVLPKKGGLRKARKREQWAKR